MRRFALVVVLMMSVLPLHAEPARGDDQFPAREKSRIVISQDEQKMYIYEGARLARTFPVSTGWPGKRQTTTPPWAGKVGEFWGTFQSFGTTQDLGYWLFTDYLADDSWNGDILIHGAPYLPGPNGQKQYSLDQIGRAPASHGCIQMLPQDAEWFHQWDPVGVQITINPFSHGTQTYPKLGVGAQLTGAPPATPVSSGAVPGR